MFIVIFYVADPLSLIRDHRAKEVLTAQGITVRSFNADLLYEPWDVNDGHGQPFTTFTAFWERCLSMPYDPESPLLPPKRIIPGLTLFGSFLSLSFLLVLLTMFIGFQLHNSLSSSLNK